MIKKILIILALVGIGYYLTSNIINTSLHIREIASLPSNNSQNTKSKENSNKKIHHIGQVKNIFGKVSLTRGKINQPLKIDSVIQVGDKITTSEKSFVKVMMIDKTAQSLGANSRLEFTTFEFRSPHDRDNIVTLLKGALRTKVSIKNSKEDRIGVKTKTVSLGVRGTEFITVVDNELTEVTLLEGIVNITNNQKQQFLLTPRHRYKEDNSTSRIEPVPLREIEEFSEKILNVNNNQVSAPAMPETIKASSPTNNITKKDSSSQENSKNTLVKKTTQNNPNPSTSQNTQSTPKSSNKESAVKKITTAPTNTDKGSKAINTLVERIDQVSNHAKGYSEFQKEASQKSSPIENAINNAIGTGGGFSSFKKDSEKEESEENLENYRSPNSAPEPTTASTGTVEEVFSPCDLNKDGECSIEELMREEVLADFSNQNISICLDEEMDFDGDLSEITSLDQRLAQYPLCHYKFFAKDYNGLLTHSAWIEAVSPSNRTLQLKETPQLPKLTFMRKIDENKFKIKETDYILNPLNLVLSTLEQIGFPEILTTSYNSYQTKIYKVCSCPQEASEEVDPYSDFR